MEQNSVHVRYTDTKQSKAELPFDKKVRNPVRDSGEFINFTVQKCHSCGKSVESLKRSIMCVLVYCRHTCKDCGKTWAEGHGDVLTGRDIFPTCPRCGSRNIETKRANSKDLLMSMLDGGPDREKQ